MPRRPLCVLLLAVSCRTAAPTAAPPISFHPVVAVAAEQVEDDDDKKKDDKPKWDVEKPAGPTHDVAIDTDEGTWDEPRRLARR